MLQLREHQLSAIQKLEEGFDQGHTRQLLYGPTGVGKTECAIAIMQEYAKKYNRCAMVMDRVVLVEQTSLRLGKYQIDHGVMQASHWRYRPSERIQICSIQTLSRRKKMPTPDLLLYDECFVAGTKVSTPNGDKDIDKVRCGDIVLTQAGYGVVEATSAKQSNDLYQLEFDDGTTITCTGNHPFFTQDGWKIARELERGESFFSEQGVRTLWGCVQALDQKGSKREDNFHQRREELEQARVLLNILCQEIKESDEQSSVSSQNEGEVKRDHAQAYSSWRQRALASFTSFGATSRTRGRVGGRVFGTDKLKKGEWLSVLLQNRHSKYGEDDCDRGGRSQSHDDKEKGCGSQEDRISCFPRLVGISRIESEGTRTVYNLQVSGHPSYFANGKLVHNCHVLHKSMIDYIKDNPQMKVIGLSATPFTKGMANLYTNIVNASTTEHLTDNSFLCPLKVFIAKEIDMSGAKKIAGEWAADEVASRGMKITGDIVSEWVKKTYEIFGEAKKTIVFCSGVDHGRDLEKQFNAAGYNFVSISYKEDDEFKRLTIEDFARPDTRINGLIATDILTKGFDVSDVMIGISARPFSKSFSSHVQQVGRVLRSHPGKEFAIWLDHAGNYLRFRDDWDNLYSNGVSELKEGGEAVKKEPTEREKKEAKCPKCQALWTFKSDTCGSCGFVRIRMSTVESVPGELKALEAANKKLRVENQDFYSQLLFYAQTKGYKPGWAYHKYQEKFNVKPSGLAPTPKHPSPEVLNWIKSRAIAFAKSKARRV